MLDDAGRREFLFATFVLPYSFAFHYPSAAGIRRYVRGRRMQQLQY